MKRFKLGDRVCVIREDEALQEIRGASGTVIRTRKADDGAWVRMQSLPDALRSFPAGDERQNDIILYPEECELAKPVKAGGG